MPIKEYRARQSGFTLIELMVVVAIIGIVAAFAIPSYRQSIIRGNRAAAQAEMMEIDNREQQFLLANRAYASKTTLEANGYALPNEVGVNYSYAITLGGGTLPSYQLTFTALGRQTVDGNLTLDNNGIKAPADKW